MKFDKLIKRARAVVPLINPQNKSFHCSFLLNKNKIISFGYNDGWITHPISKRYKFRFDNTHSELAAITRAKWYIDKLHTLTLVNVRFKRNGEVAMARPCSKCQEMLKDFRIEDIYYTNNGGDFVRM